MILPAQHRTNAAIKNYLQFQTHQMVCASETEVKSKDKVIGVYVQFEVKWKKIKTKSHDIKHIKHVTDDRC